MTFQLKSLGFLSILSAGALISCLTPPPLTRETPGAAADGTQASGASLSTQAGPYTWKNVVMLGGGFVTGIIFSPAQKDLIYARTDVGGAYRWNPADSSWIPLTDHYGRADSNYLGVESIAVDPHDPNKVYMALGMYTQSWAGTGAMVRSSDQGKAWEQTDLSIKMGGNEYGRSTGERLAVDPNDTKLLLFGSRRNGMWKSSDGSKTWTKLAGYTLPDDPAGIGINFVLFDKKSGSPGKPTPVIYAGVANLETSLYRSTDAGATWKPVPKQPSGVMPHHAGIDSAGALYLSYGNGPGPGELTTGSIWKYEAKGDVWTDITPLVPGKLENDKFGYAGLSVAEDRAGTLMVTTLDRWTHGDEIFRTVDGGKTWRAIAQKAVRDDAGAKYLYWHRDKVSAVGWMGDIDIDPFNVNRAMYVTGQGIWGTDDAGQADTDQPTHWSFRCKGLEETVVTDLASPPSGPELLSTVGDLGGFKHDDINKAPPQGMFGDPIFGWGSSIDFAETAPNVVARVGRGDKAKGAYSTDAGETWKAFGSEPPKNEGGGEIVVSADGKVFFWAPKSAAPALSTDNGASWVRSVGLPEPAKVPDWAPINVKLSADRVNPKKFYLYDVLTGIFYVSTDGAANFTATRKGLPTLPEYQLMSGSTHAVPGIEGDVWVTTGKEIYRSADSGKNFDPLGQVEESHALGFGKAAPGATFPAVYLIGKLKGTNGFFRSDDAGKSWVRINDDLHQFGGGAQIIGDPRVFGRAYVGTGGRGILYGEPK
jgi:xyloglucan-specific exo-beta-1,4-glucanase